MRWKRRNGLERLGGFQVRQTSHWRILLTKLSYGKILIGLVTMGGLLLILYAGGTTTAPKLEVGKPAPASIRAPRSETYVDTVETEKLRQKARSAVPSQYDDDPHAAQEAAAITELVFQTIIDAKSDPTLLSDQQRIEQIKQYSAIRLQDHLLLAALRAPVQILENAQRYAVSIVREEMGRGIHDNRADDRVEAQRRIKEAAQALPYSDDLCQLVYEVGRSAIRPNKFYSPKKTADKKEEAAKNVEPKMAQLRRNQLIVRKGEVVTQRHLDALRALGMAKRQTNLFRALGLIAAAAAIVLVLGFYTYRQCIDLFVQDRPMMLLGALILVHAGLCQLSIATPVYEVVCLASGAMCAILVATVLRLRLAVMTSAILGLITGLASPSGAAHLVVAVTLAGFAAAYAGTVIAHAGELFFRTVPIVAVSNAALLTLGSSVAGLDPDLLQAGLAAAGGALGAVLAVFLSLGLDRWLGVTTQLRLLQLASPTTPILNRMAVEAPGTYTHTMAVANLVQAGVAAINGNTLLARVGTYYHDIGKLARPQYFTENQFEAENPHDRLEPSLSARIIIAHVKDGLAMAEDLGLPPAVRDFIPMHHGTTLVAYFYNKACEQAGKKVPEEGFRHVGPKPQTAETAVLMFADTMEAASRTLDDKSPAKLETFVEMQMQRKIEDGQLDECPITLAQLEKVKQAFVSALAGTYHQRVRYPGQEPSHVESPAELAAKLPRDERARPEASTGITVQNRQSLPVDETALQEVARRTLDLEARHGSAEICIVLVDDAEIQRLNREYRGTDRPTNVLAFDARENGDGIALPPGVPQPEVWGDVVISVETAQREAEAAGHDLAWELRWLTAHGILHLMGHDDETGDGLEVMRARQFEVVGRPPKKESQGAD